MDWNEVKEKILIFGIEDYVFADMFVSIVSELNAKDNIHNTFSILHELLRERLIDIFLFKKGKNEIIDIIKFSFNEEKDIVQLIKKIDEEWKLFNYDLPEPNQLFWVTTTDKGIEVVNNLDDL